MNVDYRGRTVELSADEWRSLRTTPQGRKTFRKVMHGPNGHATALVVVMFSNFDSCSFQVTKITGVKADSRPVPSTDADDEERRALEGVAHRYEEMFGTPLLGFRETILSEGDKADMQACPVMCNFYACFGAGRCLHKSGELVLGPGEA